MIRPKPYLALVTALIAVAGCERQPVEARTPRAPSASINPVARVNLTVLGAVSGCGYVACGYHYRFDAYESTDADGSIVSYQWIENGVTVSTSATYYVTALRAYEACTGNQKGTLKVTDNNGDTGTVCYGYTPL